jgi:peptidase M23-like protein
VDPVLVAVVLLVGFLVITSPRIPKAGWVYPVPDLQRGNVLYKAVISSAFGTSRTDAKGNAMSHRGVDIFYQRRGPSDLRAEYPPGSAGGSPGYFMPSGIPVFAARDGVVWSAGKTDRGYAVVISHENPEQDGKPFATFYQHMVTIAIGSHARGVNTITKKPTQVKAGQVIGVIGGDPLVPPHLRHLHFALWYGGTDESAIDPAGYMAAWPHLVWTVKG